jgi:hypothetical protein
MNTRQAAETHPGAEVVVGKAVIGHVEGVVRDPVSGRVWRLVTRYGPANGGRRVAVPIEWIVRGSTQRVVLGVGTRSLDQLVDYDGASRSNGAAMPGGHALTLAAIDDAHTGRPPS